LVKGGKKFAIFCSFLLIYINILFPHFPEKNDVINCGIRQNCFRLFGTEKFPQKNSSFHLLYSISCGLSATPAPGQSAGLGTRLALIETD
jgi:hypothetical protein